MDLLIVALMLGASACDGLGSVLLTLSWAVGWPFAAAARGLFHIADRISFGGFAGDDAWLPPGRKPWDEADDRSDAPKVGAVSEPWGRR